MIHKAAKITLHYEKNFQVQLLVCASSNFYCYPLFFNINSLYFSRMNDKHSVLVLGEIRA